MIPLNTLMDARVHACAHTNPFKFPESDVHHDPLSPNECQALSGRSASNYRRFTTVLTTRIDVDTPNAKTLYGT